MELRDDVYYRIVKLCSDGDKLADNCNYDKAIRTYQKALKLLPTPREKWEACIWIYAALGDAYFYKKEYEIALQFFFDALNCVDGFSNPFINLRIGQCFFEKKNLIKAKEYLLNAYLLDGKNVFELEDKKYFNFICLT